MIRATDHISHLLVSGVNLREVTMYGAMLGSGFSRVTLAESPAPMSRIAKTVNEPGLLSVVLWREGDDDVPTSQPGRLVIVSMDGTYPPGMPQSTLHVLASDGVAVLQATISILTADGTTGVRHEW
jgi:hypothetical protein